jgi:hypothetical protein
MASELGPTAALRAELTDDLHDLERAPTLPTSQSGTKHVTLESVLGKRLDLASLVSALDLPQFDVMRLLRGKLPLRPGQVEAVSQATGLPIDEIENAILPLPENLVVEIEHPAWRLLWTQRAHQLGISEADAQLAGAYNVFALAARQTGGESPDWHERLRHFFQRHPMRPGEA